ncbi:carbon monoxide dehydrogenase [Caldanaerobacter subterraneus subsp. yonseiensis KB-1]|uniref:Carbon monoxide dehydrogenase n=1 Tax=Caldanaerobacter subterraneus subsp. yonseiensis KB-1 TaxID=1388761 RepID=U5CTF5_CALSX|nr:anaerobic carbon-monoxide dehydrogenase catalytic subunit [Caldanaerobacter subterraneus]ERM92236.1 carbon monoxide dehydrogenase [Caldanaerobacter subterraneus subsp. yonseiensis KB-1]
MAKLSKTSLDPAVVEMVEKAKSMEIKTVWDRYQAMVPQCGFGETGLCCRHCLMGPCRIEPFGGEPKRGICGATADVIVARGLDRAIAAGAAAHSGHARHLAHTLKMVAKKEARDYSIKDKNKLYKVAESLGISTEGKSEDKIALAVADAALSDFNEKPTEAPTAWVAKTVTEKRRNLLTEQGLMPKGIDYEISDIMHRTHMGCDADPINLLQAGIRAGLADLAGCTMGTEISDILFGTPQPVVSEANLGVLKADAVNVAVHGHNPVLSEIIVEVAEDMKGEAQAVGAKGVNVVGICCTGNEVLMRHGIPSCTHSLSQEMALITGALDAVVMDYQCIYPSLATVAECMGTKLITTMETMKLPGAIHIPFEEKRAKDIAREIIRQAIQAFTQRRGKPVDIPQVKHRVVAGFSVEAIVNALSKLNAEDPLKPLIDNIVSGNLRGVCLFCGCNNVKVPQDRNFTIMVRRMLKENVLVIASGCGAGALMRHGFMDPSRTKEVCGEGLKAVLTAIGEANGLGEPLPPVLHIGSCVDTSRAVALATALGNRLGVDIDQLPVVASAPEAMAEKAVAIGTWAVAIGIPTHVGVPLPVVGGPLVTRVLTDRVKELTGGYFIVELDPEAAAQKLLTVIDERRAALGLSVPGGGRR